MASLATQLAVPHANHPSGGTISENVSRIFGNSSWVYVLRRKSIEDGEFFYVGSTRRPIERVLEHMDGRCETTQGHAGDWELYQLVASFKNNFEANLEEENVVQKLRREYGINRVSGGVSAADRSSNPVAVHRALSNLCVRCGSREHFQGVCPGRTYAVAAVAAPSIADVLARASPPATGATSLQTGDSAVPRQPVQLDGSSMELKSIQLNAEIPLWFVTNVRWYLRCAGWTMNVPSGPTSEPPAKQQRMSAVPSKQTARVRTFYECMHEVPEYTVSLLKLRVNADANKYARPHAKCYYGNLAAYLNWLLLQNDEDVVNLLPNHMPLWKQAKSCAFPDHRNTKL